MENKTLYTRCPTCTTAFKVTDELLAAAAGKVRCGACLAIFQATDYMLEPTTPIQPSLSTDTKTNNQSEVDSTINRSDTETIQSDEKVEDSVEKVDTSSQEEKVEENSNDSLKDNQVNEGLIEQVISEPKPTIQQSELSELNEALIQPTQDTNINIESTPTSTIVQADKQLDEWGTSHSDDDTKTLINNERSSDPLINDVTDLELPNITEPTLGALNIDEPDFEQPDFGESDSVEPDFEQLDFDESDFNELNINESDTSELSRDKPDNEEFDSENLDFNVSDEDETNDREPSAIDRLDTDKFIIDDPILEGSESNEHENESEIGDTISDQIIPEQDQRSPSLQEEALEIKVESTDDLDFNDIDSLENFDNVEQLTSDEISEDSAIEFDDPELMEANQDVLPETEELSEEQNQELSASEELSGQLSEQMRETGIEPDPLDEFSDIVENQSAGIKTKLGIVVISLLLIISFFQIWSNRQAIAWSETWGGSMKAVCGFLPCNLKPRRDVNNIRILQRQLSPDEEQEDIFDIKLSLMNEASFDQPYPTIKIVFSNTNGEDVLEKSFTPSDYLEEAAVNELMPSGSEVHIHFKTPVTNPDALGFNFIFE